MPPREAPVHTRPRAIVAAADRRHMVIGIGLDLVETARVEQALERFGERFVGKLMDPEEAAALPRPAPSARAALALAVAGKEAASKALGTGWSQGVRWRDVVVSIGARGRASGSTAAPPRWRARCGSSGRSRVRLAVRGSARGRRVLAALVTRPRAGSKRRGATSS